LLEGERRVKTVQVRSVSIADSPFFSILNILELTKKFLSFFLISKYIIRSFEHILFRNFQIWKKMGESSGHFAKKSTKHVKELITKLTNCMDG